MLVKGKVTIHTFIIGELACGKLKYRREILSLLDALPSSDTLSENETLYFIGQRKLMGLEIGLVDVHLLASAIITKTPLWTFDRQLKELSNKLNILYDPPRLT